MELDLRRHSLVPRTYKSLILNGLQNLPLPSACQTFDTRGRHRSNPGDPLRGRRLDLAHVRGLTAERSQNVPVLHNENEMGIRKYLPVRL